jgi:hypothetical protein
VVGISFMGSTYRPRSDVCGMGNREDTTAYPVILYEPVTKLELYTGISVLHNNGDTRITVTFHNIIVPPQDLIAATRSLKGKMLLHKNSETGAAYMVVDDMRKVGEGWSWGARVWHVFGYLVTVPVSNPLDMSEIIETENVKLLEE